MLYTWTYVKLSILYPMEFFLVIFGHFELLTHCSHGSSATLLVEYKKYSLITPYQTVYYQLYLVFLRGVSFMGPFCFLFIWTV